MSQAEVRVRRPKRHEQLIQQMREEAGFSTLRDVMLFAASIGRTQNRRVPFDEHVEPIRYETFVDPMFAETLVNMIAAVEFEQDAEILSGDRLGERVAVVEEYVNGGLDFLQEQLALRQVGIEQLVIMLTQEALTEDGGLAPLPLERLLDS